MTSIPIENGKKFGRDDWNQMVIEAAESRKKSQAEFKNIYRVTHFNGSCALELKTDQEIRQYSQGHGYYTAISRKMSLKEVINITRIASLSEESPIEQGTKDLLKESLNVFASRSETKYNNDGFRDSIRKVIAVFLNLFTTNSVTLFKMPEGNAFLQAPGPSDKINLPWVIGSNADFARLVNERHFS